mmetsp:Transcript_96913/g.278365  ORF Transcript_96913/g.278365 Transcript_96913/m.278365 type:complete len:241 (-) Transcript_96913:1-723(-)
MPMASTSETMRACSTSSTAGQVSKCGAPPFHLAFGALRTCTPTASFSASGIPTDLRAESLCAWATTVQSRGGRLVAKASRSAIVAGPRPPSSEMLSLPDAAWTQRARASSGRSTKSRVASDGRLRPATIAKHRRPWSSVITYLSVASTGACTPSARRMAWRSGRSEPTKAFGRRPLWTRRGRSTWAPTTASCTPWAALPLPPVPVWRRGSRSSERPMSKAEPSARAIVVALTLMYMYVCV